MDRVAGYHAVAICGECGGQIFKVFIGDGRSGIAYQCQICDSLDKGRWSSIGQPEAPKLDGNAAMEGAGDVSHDMVSPKTGVHRLVYMREYMRKRRAKAKQSVVERKACPICGGEVDSGGMAYGCTGGCQK
jgi:hypothetical protein